MRIATVHPDMLGELAELQATGEEIINQVQMSIAIESRDTEGDELVESTYVFGYAKEWDKWTFQEYKEKRTPDTRLMSDRNWTETEHIFWQDSEATPQVSVPNRVADELAEATGADSVTIQVPVGPVDETGYRTIYDSNGEDMIENPDVFIPEDVRSGDGDA